MPLTIKRCEDINRILPIWSLTYNSGAPIDPQSERITDRHDMPYEASLDGNPVGAFTIYDLSVSRGRTELRCGGIASVAVLPSERKSGVGGEMMKFSIEEMRNQGFDIAALYAFRESYYRKFGYEVAGGKLNLKVDTGRLPKFKQSLECRLLKVDDLPIFKPCYEEFAFKRSGLNLRHGRLWERILPKDTNKVIYAVGDPVEAYAIVQHDITFWVEQKIDELVWTSARGYESIMAVLSGIAINKTHLSWSEPTDSPYRAKYCDRGAEVTGVGGHACWRVLNVKSALEKLKPSYTGEFTIEVKDEHFEENRGPWKVSFEPGKVSVSTTKDADIVADIRQFSQAFMGEPSIAQLAMNGQIEVRNEAAVNDAALLLPHSATVCYDFF